MALDLECACFVDLEGSGAVEVMLLSGVGGGSIGTPVLRLVVTDSDSFVSTDDGVTLVSW